MKKYTRISCSFTPTGLMAGLDKDDIVNEALNAKLQEFLKDKKWIDYRIINVETVVIPRQEFSSTYNLVCMHLEYEI